MKTVHDFHLVSHLFSYFHKKCALPKKGCEIIFFGNAYFLFFYGAFWQAMREKHLHPRREPAQEGQGAFYDGEMVVIAALARDVPGVHTKHAHTIRCKGSC